MSTTVTCASARLPIAFAESEQFVFSFARVAKTFERRSGGAEKDRGVF